MFYYELLLLAIIVVFIVDISGIVDTMKRALSRWLSVKIERIKPFDCSLCMVWWCGLAYLLIIGRFSLGPLVFVAVLATCSVQIGGLLQLMRGVVQWVIDSAFRVLEK